MGLLLCLHASAGAERLHHAFERRALEELGEDVGCAHAGHDGVGREGRRDLLDERLIAEHGERRREFGRNRLGAFHDLVRFSLDALELGFDLRPHGGDFLIGCGRLALEFGGADIVDEGLFRQLALESFRLRRRFVCDLLKTRLRCVLLLPQVRFRVGGDLGDTRLQLEANALLLDSRRGFRRFGDCRGLAALDLLGALGGLEIAFFPGDAESGPQGFGLGFGQHLLDVVVTDGNVEYLDIVDAHAVLFHDSAGALVVLIPRFTENGVANDVDDVLVELLDAVALCGVPDHRAEVVHQELDVVLDREPLLGPVAFEVHAVREGDAHLHEVLGFHVDDVRDAVVPDAEIHRPEQIVVGLRLAGREFHRHQRLVVFEEDRVRPLYDAAFAALVDDEHGVARPDIDGNGAVEARVRAEVEALCARFPIYPDLSFTDVDRVAGLIASRT